MKNTLPHLFRGLAAAVALAVTAIGARASVTMQLDRTDIGSDESAELTVSASGNGSSSIRPPSVPGLQFTPISQSSQIEIINGNASSTSSIMYEVTAQGPGTYTIPSPDPNAAKLTLRVRSGAGGGNSSPAAVASGVPSSPATSVSSSPAPALPTPAVSGANPSAQAPHMTANGAAFLRMQMPKRDLYVGENVPVDIQVGLRSGMAATLNGLPTLSADAFTLNKLTTKPEQTQELINGEPYTIVTWHSVLAAVKPGEFSLAVQTPVTVQVRTKGRMPGNMGDMFNDPFFQGFFGGVTQKELTLSNEPSVVKVLPLPTNGQPANFSGAVGNFTATSEVSPTKGTVGDPLTLRLKISGAGAFDRVDSSMLSTADGWKTYRASGKFVPADSVGYRGEKDFEQAVVPQRPGHQTVPSLSFSFFNPETQKYEVLETPPIVVEIEPGSGTVASANTTAPAQPSQPVTPAPATNGLRPDMTETGVAISTLRPLYFQPGFLVSQSALALSFIGAGLWLRRSNRQLNDPAWQKGRQELQAVHGFLAEMDSAAAQQDAATFFFAARQALQQSLASKWKMTPGAITLAEIDARLNGANENIRQIFALADELAYSGGAAIDADFSAWKQTVHQLIKETKTV